MTGVFNPPNLDNLGANIERAFLASTPTLLTAVKTFPGDGLYTLYYTGEFPAYEALATKNSHGLFLAPLYVGKTEVSRKRTTSSSQTRSLYNRLLSHRRSISEAENIDLDDFYVRWLVMEPFWIGLGENVLINRFGPVWNAMVSGFDSTSARTSRHGGNRSSWDTLHPGRTNTSDLQDQALTQDVIAADVSEYLRSRLQV